MSQSSNTLSRHSVQVALFNKQNTTNKISNYIAFIHLKGPFTLLYTTYIHKRGGLFITQE